MRMRQPSEFTSVADLPTIPSFMQTNRFVVILRFDVLDASLYIDDIRRHAAHIPKYWAVSVEDRKLIERLFETPIHHSSLIAFYLDIESEDHMVEHYAELFSDIAKKSEHKTFPIDGLKPFDSIYCSTAWGGLKADVQRMALDRSSSGSAPLAPTS